MIYITRRKELAIGFPSPLSVLPKVLRGHLAHSFADWLQAFQRTKLYDLCAATPPYRLVPIWSETNGTRYS